TSRRRGPNRGRKAREILRGLLPLRAAIHQGPFGQPDRRRADRLEGGEIRREHQGPPLCPLQSGRRSCQTCRGKARKLNPTGRPRDGERPAPHRMEMTKPAYHRILLKLSGEVLIGQQGFGVDPVAAARIASEIHEVHEMGVETAVVVGGGNFVRGVAASAHGIDRVVGDHMGMLATIINSLALQDALEKCGSQTRVVTAIEVREIAEPFIRRRAIRHLEKGRVVILAGGTGNPYFSTDTAAALRAMEIRAEVILKATKVDGIYEADPNIDPSAKMLERISHHDVLSRRLAVMDTTAISLCMDNGLPIVVFNLNVFGNLKRVVMGEKIGSTVSL